jgi:uncharacterized protein
VWEPGKPSQNENEYFARRDAEWLREQRAKLDAERASRSKEQPKIKCPRDGGELEERAFQNLKVDVCPKCNGVWLDAGELEMAMLLPREEVLRVAAAVKR